MKLDSKKLRYVLMGGLGLSALIFLLVMVIGMSFLSKQSRHMVDLKVKSETADAQLSSLEQTKKDVEKYSYFKDVAKSVIPSDKDEAQTVLDIFQLADQAGIQIQSINFPTSSLGIGSSATAPSTGSATAVPAQNLVSQAKPVTGIPGLYSLELTITPSADNTTPPDKKITYDKMLDFLRRIEGNRRTAQVTQINIEPSGANPLKFSLTLNTFLKP